MRSRLFIIVFLAILMAVLPILVKSSYPGQAPTASFTYSPAIPGPDDIITFDASTSFAPGGWIVSYSWDFGDGIVTTTSNPIITHSYPIDGNYTVQLTVTDNGGLTDIAVAVVQVQKDISFRVCFYGTVIPSANVQVSVYYNNGTAWAMVPATKNNPGVTMEYDSITQPKQAKQYRNPGYTASILLNNATNIEFDTHPSSMYVFFKFQWLNNIAYWPNDTTTYYRYEKDHGGSAEANNFEPGEKPYWDPSASAYVIKAAHIKSSECEPIIAGIYCPPPTQNYYLTVRTDPSGIPTIPGEGWYTKNTNVTLTAPTYVNVSTTTRYRFNYWDVDGPSKDTGVNPIIVLMTANHTATAHYVLQYNLTLASSPLYVGTQTGAGWYDNGSSASISTTQTVPISSGKRYNFNSWTTSNMAEITTPNSPSTTVLVDAAKTVTANYVTQYYVVFNQTGLDSSASGTVLTVNGTGYPYGSPLLQGWYNSNTVLNFSYSSPVSSGTTGKRFTLSSVNASSPYPVNGPATITGTYLTQYLLTMATSFGSTSPSVGTTWETAGSQVSVSATPPTAGSGERYVWNGWAGSGSGSYSGSSNPATVTMNGPITETACWVHQYLLTMATSFGSTSPSVGTTWETAGSQVSVSATPPSAGSGEQYLWNGWSGSGSGSYSGSSNPATVTMNGPITETACWVHQYLLTMATSFGSTSPSVGTTWETAGSQVSVSATPPSAGSGEQYLWNGWSGSGSGSYSGSSNPATVTMNGPIIETASWTHQYQVTFAQSGVGTDFYGSVMNVNGTEYDRGGHSGWYNSGANITFSFYSPLVVTSNGKQYVWSYTSGTLGQTVQSGSLKVAASGSVVGNYVLQNAVIFDQLGVSSDFSGTVLVVNGTSYSVGSLPVPFYCTVGTVYTFAFQSPLTVTASVKQYIWNGTTGLPSVQSGSITVTAYGSIVANYVTQYYVVFNQTGLDSSASGTVLTVNGTGYPYGSPLPQGWYNATSVLSFNYSSPVSGGTTGKQFILSSVNASSPCPVNGPATITGTYLTQYLLTMATSFGSTSPSVGTTWETAGSQVSVSATPPSAGSGEQYLWNGWSGSGSGSYSGSSNPATVTMNGPIIETASWTHQYQVTFAQSGLDFSASGSTVVTVNVVAVPYDQLSYSLWVDSGGQVSYAYESIVSSSNPGEQFRLDTVNGPSSPITVTGLVTLTGNYVTQYYLTVQTSPSGVNSPSGQGWHDASTYASVSTAQYVDIVSGSSRYNFTGWTSGDMTEITSPTSPLTTVLMDMAKTVTANYMTQYNITIGQSGLGSDFTGTVVVINGTGYGVSGLPAVFWWDANSVHNFTYQSPLVVDPSAEQYVWVSTLGLSTLQSDTITVTGSGSVIGNYKTRYYLTLATNPVGVNSPSGAGWYDANTNATVSTDAFVNIVSGSSRYRFNGWTPADITEIADPTVSPTTVLMDASKTVTANYAVQYNVTFNQSGVDPDFTGTVVTVDSVNYAVGGLHHSFWWDDSSSHSFAFQSPLIVTANNKQYVWTDTTGLSTLQSGTIVVSSSGSVTGNYKTQYYLTVTSSYDSPTPTSGWFDSGASITASVTSPFAGPSGTQYVCTGWSGAGNVLTSGSLTTTSFTMTQASSITWNWKIQYLLTVLTDPNGLSPQPSRNPLGQAGPANGWWYDTSTSVTLAAQSVSGYTFNYWDVDSTSQGTGVNPITVSMNGPRTAKANYTGAPLLLPSVAIDPSFATIYLGNSVSFTSAVSGGTQPYTYQWYLDGSPVSGATLSTWIFTPTSSDIYYVYLTVTDANSNTAQSSTARITVFPTPPVGGYSDNSLSIVKQAPRTSLGAYVALVALFAAGISLRKRKRK